MIALLVALSLIALFMAVTGCAIIRPGEIASETPDPKAPASQPVKKIMVRGPSMLLWWPFDLPKEYLAGKLSMTPDGGASLGETKTTWFPESAMTAVYLIAVVLLVLAGLAYYLTTNWKLAAAFAVPAILLPIGAKAIETAPWVCVGILMAIVGGIAYAFYAWWRGARSETTGATIVTAIEGFAAKLADAAWLESLGLPGALSKLTPDQVVVALKKWIGEKAAGAGDAKTVKAEVSAVKRETGVA